MLAPVSTSQQARVVVLREDEETIVPSQDVIVPRRSGREMRLSARHCTDSERMSLFLTETMTIRYLLRR